MCPMKGSHGVYLLLSAASNQIEADSLSILEFASNALINAV